jgi:hypothetical protein
MAEERTLSIDPITGEDTRSIRVLPDTDTSPRGGKTHPYQEDVCRLSGRLYDHALGVWREAGHDASRPPGERHGPFTADGERVVFDVSFLNRVVGSDGASPIHQRGGTRYGR